MITISKELDEILLEAKKGTTEERVEVLGSIIGDMMQLVLKIPGIFDELMNRVNDKLLDLEQKIDEIKAVAASSLVPQVKNLPPPPDPKEDIDQKLKIVKANTRVAIIQELKDMFDFKKNLERKKKDQDNQ